MSTNRVTMKSPEGTIIETSSDMVEYYSKMGYTKVDGVDNKKPISNFKFKKDKDK